MTHNVLSFHMLICHLYILLVKCLFMSLPIFFFFWLRWSSLMRVGFSLVAASGGLLFVAVRGLLIVVVASLVVEHGL